MSRDSVIASLRALPAGFDRHAIYDQIIAPLLAEAERRGAEKGWDEGWRFGTGMFAIQEPLANPYRAGADQ